MALGSGVGGPESRQGRGHMLRVTQIDCVIARCRSQSAKQLLDKMNKVSVGFLCARFIYDFFFVIRRTHET